MYEEESQQVSAIIDKLHKEANAKAIFVIDKNGQLIADAGETEALDATSLASLTAGNIAATDGLAKLVGEKEFAMRLGGTASYTHLDDSRFVPLNMRNIFGMSSPQVQRPELRKIFTNLYQTAGIPIVTK